MKRMLPQLPRRRENSTTPAAFAESAAEAEWPMRAGVVAVAAAVVDATPTTVAAVVGTRRNYAADDVALSYAISCV